MNRRLGTLGALTALLAVTYVIVFTDWLSPVPIEIASQIRPIIQPPRFGRRPRSPESTPPTTPSQPTSNGKLTDPPNGAAHVTFSLDASYSLTALKVIRLETEGQPRRVVWELKGRTPPIRALIYGNDPGGLKPLQPSQRAEPLQAGIPYQLEVTAGRRKGTNSFQTVLRLTPSE